MPKIKFSFSKCVRAIRGDSYKTFKESYETMTDDQINGIEVAVENNKKNLARFREFEHRYNLNKSQNLNWFKLIFVKWLRNIYGNDVTEKLRIAFRAVAIDDWETFIEDVATKSVVWTFKGCGTSELGEFKNKVNAIIEINPSFKLTNEDGEMLFITPENKRNYPMKYIVIDKHGKRKYNNYISTYINGEEDESVTKHFKIDENDVNAFAEWMDHPAYWGNVEKLEYITRGENMISSSRFMRKVGKVSKTWSFVENGRLHEIKYFGDHLKCPSFTAMFKNNKKEVFMIRIINSTGIGRMYIDWKHEKLIKFSP